MAVSRVVIVALVLVTLGCRAAPDPIRVFTDSIDLTDTEGPGAGVALGDLDGDGDLDIVQMMGRHDGALARVFLTPWWT